MFLVARVRALRCPNRTPVTAELRHRRANAKWSDPATWGGTVPAAGADVVIPADKNVLLDMDTPALGSLTINGSLTFSPAMDLALTSRYVVVQGTLQIGTESSEAHPEGDDHADR